MASKWFRQFTTVSENIVKLLLLAVEVFLLLLSIMRTSIVSDYEEHSDYAIDNPLKHVPLVILVGISVFMVSFFRNKLAKRRNKISMRVRLIKSKSGVKE